MKDKYIVIMVHSFDSETYAQEFDDYFKAIAFLHWSWERYLNEERMQSIISLAEEFCYHESEYAKVCWDNGEETEFILSSISEPNKEFTKLSEEEWKNYL